MVTVKQIAAFIAGVGWGAGYIDVVPALAFIGGLYIGSEDAVIITAGFVGLLVGLILVRRGAAGAGTQRASA